MLALFFRQLIEQTLKQGEFIKTLIIGFGSQATAWALNLRDSKFPFDIYIRKSSQQITKLRKLQFDYFDDEDVYSKIGQYDLILCLIPDSEHIHFLQKFKDHLKPQCSIVYAHGLSMVKDQLNTKFPTFNHLLLAPKAIASQIRYNYECGLPLAAIYCPSNNKDNEKKDQPKLKKLSQAIGITELIKASWEDETAADLFSEQSLLCSLVPYGALFSFKHLTEKGIDPKIAYLECFYELKLIVDTLVEQGPLKFFEMISPVALTGGQKGVKLLLNQDFQKHLKTLLNDIYSQEFFQELENIDSTCERAKVIDFWKSQDFTTLFESWGKNLNVKYQKNKTT